MLSDEKLDDLKLMRRIKRNELRLLLRAIKEKENIKVRQLLDEGVDANMTNSHGEIPLLYAIKTKNFEAADMLIKHGVDLEKRDIKNYTALGYALLIGNTSTIELLLEYGADVNKRQGKYREKPLELVCERFNQNLVQILLQFGARIGYDPTKIRYFMNFNNQAADLFLTYEFTLDCEYLYESWEPTFFYKICRHIALKRSEVDRCFKSNHYYRECIEELVEMKTIYLDGRISSYDYLKASRNQLINYSKNKNLRDTLERLLKDGKFKIYENMLKINSVIGDRYGRVYEKVSLDDFAGRYSLPILVRDNILKYLNERDINNFIRAQSKN